MILTLKDIPKPLVDVYAHQTAWDLERLFKYRIIEYDIILSNGVNLQRGLVWTPEQERELIHSILKGIRIPAITVLVEGENDTTFKILDGK